MTIKEQARDMNSLITERDAKRMIKPGESRSVIDRVEILDDGTIHTYLKGHKVAYNGYPNRENSKVIEITKRSLRLAIDWVFTQIKNPFKWFMIKRFLKYFIPKWLKFANWAIRDSKYKEEHYSHSVREIYRVFNILIDKEEKIPMKRKLRRLRDVLCMYLEIDPSYRYRAQIILPEIDLEKIKMDENDKYFAPHNLKKFKIND